MCQPRIGLEFVCVCVCVSTKVRFLVHMCQYQTDDLSTRQTVFITLHSAILLIQAVENAVLPILTEWQGEL